ncbi:biotin--[acetyl-CoA-carboxylase] ligase [Gordonia jinghuaiqii]|uniref:biotin--[biotin carboxyl-carrier protein] ligase n=1 Tax=Gordonia jinghuaiqii TaxID=2758710 RepID=A0A7D7QZQ7_9ACTN|nr:biotin--[acetyl-CoA-carboxylase] ligase [Gordonia jinghuaiqii]MCR5980018.1 biotin--[acetyl-CoA-carboxylase] ligase [Gordonia jinghuaiqii]QMT03208.1 biotin--[acetyl-CoA-carboxylase] ligase [Gordonia jinghuaiqii]
MTLDADQLRTRLADTRWHRIEVVEATGSTNADLVERAATEPVGGTVRITTDQTAGRGRHARTWTAPAGTQLAMSAAVDVGDHTEDLGWLSLLAGLAAVQGIGEAMGLRPTLKWPNDVLVGGKKVAGILSEYTRTDHTQKRSGGIAVIGTGLNTTIPQDQLPVPTATSLRVATGRDVPLTDLAASYLRALSDLLDLWPHDLDGLAARYRESSDTIGRRVRLVLPGDSEVVGTATGFDPAGRIIIDADGRQVVAAAGDVTHLRAE